MCRYFNPLPSREGKHLGIDIDKAVREFQSTPLMRGETCSGLMRMLPLAFQSTPLMRGETQVSSGQACTCSISIHSPHARGDFSALKRSADRLLFQSTPLMRGETVYPYYRKQLAGFQSTPLMRGETCEKRFLTMLQRHFNPLPSHEGRRYGHSPLVQTPSFQSTPLTRGETA